MGEMCWSTTTAYTTGNYRDIGGFVIENFMDNSS